MRPCGGLPALAAPPPGQIVYKVTKLSAIGNPFSRFFAKIFSSARLRPNECQLHLANRHPFAPPLLPFNARATGQPCSGVGEV